MHNGKLQKLILSRKPSAKFVLENSIQRCTHRNHEMSWDLLPNGKTANFFVRYLGSKDSSPYPNATQMVNAVLRPVPKFKIGDLLKIKARYYTNRNNYLKGTEVIGTVISIQKKITRNHYHILATHLDSQFPPQIYSLPEFLLEKINR